ncbi:MAG: UDP-2,3-diacylglucosamine diphosphatase [Thermodesulfobacteriota bacterium]
MRTTVYRSIWISDTHLGSRNAHGPALFEFLRRTDSEYLYLVGDIIDLYRIRRGWHWPEINTRILHLIIAKAAAGTKVLYIPGNHDHLLRAWDGAAMGNIRFQRQAIHVTARGESFLVLHGDELDRVVTASEWLARVGAEAYEALLVMNRYLNRARRLLGREYWSLAGWLKHQVKAAVNYMGSFEKTVVREAERRQVDGLICGHIHRAALTRLGAIQYSNMGDWVESCTALTEHADGSLAIVRWPVDPLPEQPLAAAAIMSQQPPPAPPGKRLLAPAPSGLFSRLFLLLPCLGIATGL